MKDICITSDWTCTTKSYCVKDASGKVHQETLFTVEGGIHQTEDYVYIYKKCPYIKVNVQLTKDGKISRI